MQYTRMFIVLRKTKNYDNKNLKNWNMKEKKRYKYKKFLKYENTFSLLLFIPTSNQKTKRIMNLIHFFLLS